MLFTFKKRKNNSFVLLLVIFSSLLLFSPTFSPIVTSSSSSGVFPPPAEGRWNITEPTVVENEFIHLTNDISVRGEGSLILRNCFIVVEHDEIGYIGITATDNSSLEIYDTTILTYTDSPWTIVIYENAHLHLEDSTLIGGWNRTYSRDLIRLYSSNNVVINNFITHTEGAIEIQYGSHNLVSGNNISYTRWASGIDMTDTCFNVITNNHLLYSGTHGIYGSGHNNIISNNTIIYTKYDGLALSGDNNTVTDNVISESKESGLSVSGSNNHLSSNILFNNSKYGMYIYKSASNNFLSRNVFFKNNPTNNLSQAIDDGANNTWFDPVYSIGNYWSDTDGSEPYPIDGAAKAFDPFPRGSDFDEDNLLDYLEDHVYGTDPWNPDSDGDLLPDGWEVHYGSDPLTNDSYLDLDGDGLTNLEEFYNHTNPLIKNQIMYLIIVLTPLSFVSIFSVKNLLFLLKNRKK
ncbi:MAG: right-handed parallel beta-helix repeat-containing protein [Candidatus Heimdallarchaeum endolithica]|uniref:Right-handed parallel beta-helix repeat-containing protein n=1 Tax=Candidatus Heimdallarchaeum endolithica TaxID=2876572 RepID=A0A9Y1BQQ1_9ARCH|nr:MAG: right-handed parallel beta-helix repeat-containing protein [Candidatus Heimdallarchaeum endolithica]